MAFRPSHSTPLPQTLAKDSLLASSLVPANQDMIISDRIRVKVIELLHQQSTPKSLSLPTYINRLMAL